MPLSVYWDNDEQTIIRCDSAGKWTWDEYHMALDEVAALARSVNHRVDLISIGTPDSAMPKGSPQPHFERAVQVLPDNVGLNITVTGSRLAAVMINIWKKLPGGKKLTDAVELVATEEEAYNIVAKDRERDRQPE